MRSDPDRAQAVPFLSLAQHRNHVQPPSSHTLHLNPRLIQALLKPKPRPRCSLRPVDETAQLIRAVGRCRPRAIHMYLRLFRSAGWKIGVHTARLSVWNHCDVALQQRTESTATKRIQMQTQTLINLIRDQARPQAGEPNRHSCSVRW